MAVLDSTGLPAAGQVTVVTVTKTGAKGSVRAANSPVRPTAKATHVRLRDVGEGMSSLPGCLYRSADGTGRTGDVTTAS